MKQKLKTSEINKKHTGWTKTRPFFKVFKQIISRGQVPWPVAVHCTEINL